MNHAYVIHLSFFKGDGWHVIKQTAPLKAPINKCQFGVSQQVQAACVLLLQAGYSGETGKWTSGAWLLFIKSIND